jgi:hypothetical protein
MDSAGGYFATEVDAKAKNNLLKSLNWAYQGLALEQQRKASEEYSTKIKKGTLNDVLLRANRGTVTADEVAGAVEAILATNASLAHSATRCISTNVAQQKVFQAVLNRYANQLDNIQEGMYDTILDVVFPNPSLNEGAQDRTRARVKETFQRAYAIVKQWYDNPQERIEKIKIDTALDAQKALGLSKKTGLELPDSFFDGQSTKWTPERRLTTLVHESTHAIQDDIYWANDDGGYIGTGPFQEADLEKRIKNASHYEFVFYRIQSIPEPVPSPIATEPAVVQAKQIAKNAWIYAINCYSDLIRYHADPQQHENKFSQEEMIKISRLFGLSTHKPGMTRWNKAVVTVSDLVSMENRVGKLGILLGSVEEAAELVPQNERTRDRILLKLVEMGGLTPEGLAIRKPRCPEKTVAMLKVAAMHCHQILSLRKTENTKEQREKSLNKFFEKDFGAIHDVNY